MNGQTFLDSYGDNNNPMTTIDPNRTYGTKATTMHPIDENSHVRAFAILLPTTSTNEQLCTLGGLLYLLHYNYSKCRPSLDSEQQIIVNRANPSRWETFRIWHVRVGSYQLRIVNQQFIRADDEGGGVVNTVANITSTWETFEIIRNPTIPIKGISKTPNAPTLLGGVSLNALDNALIWAANHGIRVILTLQATNSALLNIELLNERRAPNVLLKTLKTVMRRRLVNYKVGVLKTLKTGSHNTPITIAGPCRIYSNRHDRENGKTPSRPSPCR
eukprot:Gb_30176 [translate_table: standard]